MIDSSHFVALSVLMLVGFCIKKRFFGLPTYLDTQIHQIDQNLADSLSQQEEARKALHQAQEFYDGIEVTLNQMREEAYNHLKALEKDAHKEREKALADLQETEQRELQALKTSLNQRYYEKLLESVIAKSRTKYSNEKDYDLYLNNTLSHVNPTEMPYDTF